MKIIMNEETGQIKVAEMSLFRKFIFREISICNANKRGTFFTKGKYLKGAWFIIGRF